MQATYTPAAAATARTVAHCRRLMARAQAATRLARRWRNRAYRCRPGTLGRMAGLWLAKQYNNTSAQYWAAYSKAITLY